jgi:hypothetical protein
MGGWGGDRGDEGRDAWTKKRRSYKTMNDELGVPATAGKLHSEFGI